LQGVEHQARGFVVDLAGGYEAHDLGEGELDGVGVLKDRQIVGRVAAGAGVVGVELEALFALALVLIAEVMMADGGRSARGSIDHDVQAFVR
jgi:hypothetical protein